MTRRFEHAGAARVSLTVTAGPANSIPRKVGATVYRIVIEALTNVRRHAATATTVVVDVRQARDAVEVAVIDDGGTGPPATTGRNGVRGAVRLRLATARRDPGCGAPRPERCPRMTTRVLIADDQPGIRSAFRLVVDSQPDMDVVGEAADGLTAVELARTLRPDVVLADIRMPRMDGLEVTRLLAGPAVEQPLRVIVVTAFDLDEYVHTALCHGASGFVLKRSGPALLVEAIRAAMAGDTLISPQLTVRLLRQVIEPSAQPTGTADPLPIREREIARLVGQGLSNTEIGAELFVSAGTAKNHIANIQRKLGVRNRVGIAVWTWSTGLVRDTRR